ncbi:hypothetical protein FQR65_LT14042 [Abscondita terminalis]|nr:hypothetical protein FQR65_LT14042 [Abscondita terminalis]
MANKNIAFVYYIIVYVINPENEVLLLRVRVYGRGEERAEPGTSKRVYIILEFRSGKTISAVPENWLINGNSCYCPPKNVTKYIKEQFPCNSSWKIYKIRVFQHSDEIPPKYDKYDVVNDKVKELERKFDLSSSENDDECQNVNYPQTRQQNLQLPPCPTSIQFRSAPPTNFFSMNPLSMVNNDIH